MSDVIPPEIISEIFIRLPVVSLLRLRSVCKQFRALIDSQHFVKSHLNRSLKMNTNQSLICNIEGYLHTMDFDLFEKDFRNSFIRSKVVSSSNGLVCLTSCRDILIANPSLRKHTTLPPTRIKYPSRAAETYKVVYGFGYDPVNDDYKVVQIEIFYIPGFVLDQNEVKVYSMKSNSWRKIKDFPHIPIGMYDNGVFVNGALHWLVTVNRKLDDGLLSSLPDKIVSFDIVTEEYGQIPLPQYTPCTVPNGMKIELWELGGSLCVQCNYKKKNIDLWVMNAYGIAGSWTKPCSIEQPIDSNYMSEYLTALAYSKNGQKLLLKQYSGMLVWYDLKLEAVEDSRIVAGPISLKPYIYTDSLMKLTIEKPKINSGAKTNVAHQKKKERKRKTPTSRYDFRLKTINRTRMMVED